MSKEDKCVPKCGERHEGYRIYKIILDNLPTLIMYALGAIILAYLGIVFAVAYILYSFNGSRMGCAALVP